MVYIVSYITSADWFMYTDVRTIAQCLRDFLKDNKITIAKEVNSSVTDMIAACDN